jgi:DNA-binding MarR family transcriptional regulator
MAIEQDIKQPRFQSAHQRMAVNLLFTSNWIGDMQMRLMRPHGITLQQYNVLRILRGQYPNPVRVADIMERMLDRMSNASRLVDKLVAKELVKRTECCSDRRAVDVVLTETGLALLAEIDTLQKGWEETLCTLNETEANQLSSLLDKLRGSE